MAKQITLHNTPQFYVEYTKNWLAKTPTENKVERLIVEDIATLIEVAAEHLTPQPAELANDKKS